MIFCCIPLGACFRREPDQAPPPTSPPSEWAGYVKDRPSIVISPKISGDAGPLTIEPAWLLTQSQLLTVDEQDHLRDAIKAMQGCTLLAGNKRFPEQLSGSLSLSDGREINYVHTAQKSRWNGTDWIAPGDEHQPRFVPRQIIRIAVSRHGELLAQIDSNPESGIPEGASSQPVSRSDAPPKKWEQCLALAQKGPLSVAPDIAGQRGPLMMMKAWMEKHMPEDKWERDLVGQALLALAGKVDVSNIREYPSHPRGEVTLRESGDVVTYRFTTAGYRELPPGAVASISVTTKDDREITIGCWTPDNDGFASLKSDADTAVWAKAKLSGFRLNASHDDHASGPDMWLLRA